MSIRLAIVEEAFDDGNMKGAGWIVGLDAWLDGEIRECAGDDPFGFCDTDLVGAANRTKEAHAAAAVEGDEFWIELIQKHGQQDSTSTCNFLCVWYGLRVQKPQCPVCASKQVLFRAKDNSYGCRVCGHRWKPQKEPK